jgi:hypothetical protein
MHPEGGKESVFSNSIAYFFRMRNNCFLKKCHFFKNPDGARLGGK